MKIEVVKNNVVLVSPSNENFEIHPLWLRERAKTEDLVDKNNDQRLYDPSQLDQNLKIKKASTNNGHLNIEFTDGIKFEYEINNLLYEIDRKEPVKNIVFWDSELNKKPTALYEKNIFETKKMFDLLQDFYKCGFVIFKSVPTEDNYIVKFANSIGTIRPTNFGESFSVKSVPQPNDLAYTSIALTPHTDNPYRKPIPCIQLLHCLENEVKGGFSTLVDGFAVAEYLKKNYYNLFEILTKIKVRFRFVDKTIILENWGELIELDENNKVKQVRYSTRLDYVPALEKKELEKFYQARKLIAKLYASKQFEIKFKLEKGDLLMMDNHRLLHGRTSYDPNEGKRYLKGCYIDHDSTEGKLRYLERKYGLKWKK
ncbi:TauD/TfdA family dioxygenase [Pelagibacteraceae bacterium]|nr:TauD/TfdA family dioxygenase [Pelagibacteraceae bacterium]